MVIFFPGFLPNRSTKNEIISSIRVTQNDGVGTGSGVGVGVGVGVGTGTGTGVTLSMNGTAETVITEIN